MRVAGASGASSALVLLVGSCLRQEEEEKR